MIKEKKSAESALTELEKQLGLSISSSFEREVIPSGSYQIDRATKIGGYKQGTIIEIYGPESSGKSTIVLHAIAKHQQIIPDRKVAYIDYEHSFDPDYAEALGINLETLLVYQPDSQEQGYDMAIGLASKEICSLIVIDSHTAAVPQKIVEGDMSDVTMGLQARNNSKFLLKIKGILSKSHTTLIAVSQTRSNIGSMGGGDIATGGNSWKFYADMRFKIWKSLDKDKELNKTTLEVIKSKCGKPWGKAEFDIVWGEGIDNTIEILDYATDYNIVQKNGSWYSYNGNKLGQGTMGVRTLLNDNPKLFDEIKKLVLEHE